MTSEPSSFSNESTAEKPSTALGNRDDPQGSNASPTPNRDSLHNKADTTPSRADKTKTSSFSPISVVPEQQQDQQQQEEEIPDRSSPHTFASGYDQEWWNRMGCATTSDDDDEEDLAAATVNGTQDYSSEDDSFVATKLPVTRLTKRFTKLIDSSDDYSSLSSYTADVDSSCGLSSFKSHDNNDDPNDDDAGMDNPPKPPERTQTQEHPPGGGASSSSSPNKQQQQQQAKVKVKATTVRAAKTTTRTVATGKEQEFHMRRLQRLEGRQIPVAAAAGTAKSPPSTQQRPGTSLAALEATDDDMAAKKAAARPAAKAVVERRTAPVTVPTAGASALSLQVAARNMARGITGKSSRSMSSTASSDPAARKQAGRNAKQSAAAAMQARAAVRRIEMPRAVSRNMDLAASKMAGNGNHSSDDDDDAQEDKGPQLAAPRKKAPPKPPPSNLQEALLARNLSRASAVPMPTSVSRSNDRAAAKADLPDKEENGPQLAMSRKKALPKAPPSALQAAMQTRSESRTGSSVVPMPTNVSRSNDRAAAKSTEDESSDDEQQGPTLATVATRKKAPPTSLQAAMQMRSSSRTSSSIPKPTNVSRAMDRAAAKLGQEDDASDDEDEGPRLASTFERNKAPPTDLQAAMQARTESRSSTVPLPTSVSRAMDRAGAKMADHEEKYEEDEGPQLAVTTQRTNGPAYNLEAAMQARTASRSSSAAMPVSVSRAMDKAGAKIADEETSDDEKGPQLATAKKEAPPSDLQAAMQSRSTSRTSTVSLPVSISRAMDRAGAKMADEETSDDEQGPQLASRGARAGNDPSQFTNNHSASEMKQSSRRSVRLPATISEGTEGPQLTAPKRVPGAVASREDAALEKKIGEYADDEEEEGPTLAPPTALSNNEVSSAVSVEQQDFCYKHEFMENFQDNPELVRPDEFETVPMVPADYDVKQASGVEDNVIEAQAGIVVRAGAYAIEGMDAPSGSARDLHINGFDPTNTTQLSDQPATIVVESQPGVTAVVAETNPSGVAVLEAELYEQPHVEADLYEETDLEDDPKLQRQLRMMQVAILCSSLAGIVFVILSIIEGFGGDSTAPAPQIEGWRSVGEAVFGPNSEEGYVFFGAKVATISTGERVVTTAPGTEKDGAFNFGSLHIWEETEKAGNSTWQLTRSLEGPGPSEVAISSVAMALDGSAIAAGYPFYETGLVQIFDEERNWEQPKILKLDNSSNFGKTWFGYAIALSRGGRFLAVGAPLDKTTGSVRVFGRQPDNSWKQVGGVISAQEPNEMFGWSISLVHASNLRVAIGAPSHDTDTGLLRVYDLVDDEWVQVGTTLTGSRTLSRFGEDCDLTSDGKVLVVGVRGSPFENGEVRIFREIDGNWVAEERPIEGSEPGDGFGSALSITPNGDSLAIGCPGSNTFGEMSGYIQVWAFDGGSWIQQGSNIGGAVHSEYGTSLALSGDGLRVVGGAPQAEYDGSIAASGHFQVYDRDETA